MFNWNALTDILDSPEKVESDFQIKAISTDSRTIKPGDVFLALSGDRFDGHNYLQQVIDAGAAGVIISQDLQLSVPAIKVKDTLTAYQTIANYWRNQFSDLSLVGVTGSSGKTSSKEIIGCILKEAFDEVLLTKANTNNQIGVPQNLLGLTGKHQAAVIEMGTNYPGEINILSNCGEPDIAVLTNVGPVHLEGLGDLDGVAREKVTIFNGLKKGGLALFNDSLIDNPIILEGCPDFISYGLSDRADYQVIYHGGDFHGSSFTIIKPDKTELNIEWTLKGSHMAQNAAAAIAIAEHLKINDETIINALSNCQLPGMRMKIETINDVHWINDAYNANPDSMRSLINWLASVDQKLNYLILGDMLELGPDGPTLHADLCSYAKEKLPETKLITYGEIMTSVAVNHDSYTDIDKLKSHLSNQLKAGDYIAIKGSRGMALERLQS